MYTRFQTPAFIVKIQNRGEADRVYLCLTRDHGLVRVSARSVRKHTSKLRYHLHVLSRVDIEYVEGKGIARLVGAQSLEHFRPIHPEIQQLGAYFAQLITKLYRDGVDLVHVYEMLHERMVQLQNLDELIVSRKVQPYDIDIPDIARRIRVCMAHELLYDLGEAEENPELAVDYTDLETLKNFAYTDVYSKTQELLEGVLYG